MSNFTDPAEILVAQAKNAANTAAFQAKLAEEVLKSVFPKSHISPEAVATMTLAIAHNMK